MDKNGKIITELSPELAAKIWRQIERKRYNEKVSKDVAVQHLKQLKAQMGKELKKDNYCLYKDGVKACMEMIDKKIAKINK